jgi:molecular chaperone GrpE
MALEQDETVPAESAAEAPPAAGAGEGAGEAPPAAAAAEGEAEADLARAQADLAALEEAHRRLAADFANYRRRVERDRAGWEEAAQGELLLRLLPVFDNLRRAREAAGAAAGEQATALAAGLDMVARSLDEALAAVGVTESVRVGDPFDPATCEALGEEVRDDLAPGSVSAVLLPGYRMGGRVLRPALVRVAAAPAQEAAWGEGAAREGEG